MRAPARTHRDLIVWKEGMSLLLEVYRVAGRLPSEERYALGARLRRARRFNPDECRGRVRTPIPRGFRSLSHHR